MAKRRRWRIGVLLALLVLAAVAAVLVIATPPLIARAVENALHKAGFAEADISGVAIGYGPVIRIAHVSLAPDDRFILNDVTAHIRLKELMAGRIERLDIAYLGLTMALPSGDALTLPGYVPPVTTSDAPLPVGTIELKAADLVIGTKEGPVKAPVQVHVQSVRLANDVLDGSFALTHPLLAFSGRMDGQLTPAGTPVHFNFQVVDGYVGPDDYRLHTLVGAVVFDLASHQIDASLMMGDETAAGRNLRLDVKGDLVMKTADIAVTGFLADMAVLSPSLAGNVHMALAALVEWSDDLAISSNLDLDIKDAHLAGYVADATASLQGRLYGDMKGVVVYADRPWTARFISIDKRLAALFPTYADRPVTVAVSARTEGGPLLDYDLESNVMGVDGHLVTKAGEGAITAAGVLTLGNWQEALSVAGEHVTITMTGLELERAQLSDAGLSGRFYWDGRNGLFEGSGFASGSGAYETTSIEHVSLDMPSLNLIHGEEGTYGIHHGCMTLSIARVRSQDMTLSGLDDLCLMAGDAAVDDAVFSRLGNRTALSLAFEPVPMALFIGMKDREFSLTGDWPRLAFDGALMDETLMKATLKLEGGVIRAPQQAVKLSGLMLHAELGAQGLVDAELRIADIASMNDTALFAPLSFEMTVKPDGRTYGFESFLSDHLGIMVVEGTGTFGLQDGQANISLYPVSFIPDAVEPGDLSPALGAVLSDMTGTLSLEGRVAWSDAGVNGTGQLSLEDIAGRAGQIAFSGIGGTVNFDSLLPLATPAGQKIAIDRIQIGAPLLNGSVVFGLSDTTVLAVESVDFDLAGGSIHADPFIVDLSSSVHAGFVLQARDVDLAQIFAVGGVDGLTGEGRMNGHIPFVLSKEGVQIDDGLLEAVGVGVLRYSPDDMPAFMKGDDMRSRMLRQALQNFQYESLSLSVSGRLDETQKLALSASGANPDFLDGHPIELNFNISGDLVNAVESAVGAFGLEEMFNSEKQEKKDGKNGEIKP